MRFWFSTFPWRGFPDRIRPSGCHKKKSPATPGIFAKNTNVLVYNLNTYGIEPFSSLLQFKFHNISFANLVNKAGVVYKMINFRTFFSDESISFGLIEEFNCSCTHKK